MAKLVSMRKAAEIIGITQESVRVAIKRGKLRATIVKVPRLMVDLSDAKDYKPNEKKREAGRRGGQSMKEMYPDTVIGQSAS